MKRYPGSVALENSLIVDVEAQVSVAVLPPLLQVLRVLLVLEVDDWLCCLESLLGPDHHATFLRDLLFELVVHLCLALVQLHSVLEPDLLRDRPIASVEV